MSGDMAYLWLAISGPLMWICWALWILIDKAQAAGMRRGYQPEKTDGPSLPQAPVGGTGQSPHGNSQAVSNLCGLLAAAEARDIKKAEKELEEIYGILKGVNDADS